jgi:hypothetical protein
LAEIDSPQLIAGKRQILKLFGFDIELLENGGSLDNVFGCLQIMINIFITLLISIAALATV